MRSALSSILLFACLISAAIPTPTVPKQVEFANMKLVLTDGAIKEIQKDVNALTASPDYYQMKLDRMLLYFPIIERVFKEEGVPEDFKYLAIQESGLISDAVSSANAVGFWQFKDFTGREVGLRIDKQIDERKNIVAATKGAAKYLKRNNDYYDNWAYAMSAYQAGIGGARRYVDKSNYGAKKLTITKNTHWYIKKYIAHKIAFEGSQNSKHSKGLSLAEYKKGQNKNLVKIAKEVKVEDELLKHYNKWIKYGSIPDDRPYTVLIPVDKKISQKHLAEDKPKEKAPVKSEHAEKEIETPEKKIYPNEIKAGITSATATKIKINGVEAILAGQMDDLNSLATYGGISPEAFAKYNDLSSDSKIKAGELYYIEKKKAHAEIGFHVAKEGESLWSISQKYGIKQKKLAAKNRLSLIDEIEPGRVLWLSSTRPKSTPVEFHDPSPAANTLVVSAPVKIPSETIKSAYFDEKKEIVNDPIEEKPVETIEEESEPQQEVVVEEEPKVEEKPKSEMPGGKIEKSGKTHKVEAGETLWAISRKYEVTVDEIRDWNEMTKYDNLSIGQELFVAAPKVKTSAPPKTKEYTVKPGDTLYRIAEKHKMGVTELMDLNGKNGSDLSVGESLKVYRR